MTKLSCAIVGLPNVGKSTLFNALTKKGAESSNYPFCTIDPNVGVVDMVDPRLEVLSKISSSQKIIYAPVTFVDVAGLVKGAAQGEGLGNQFLAHIRETNIIVHVVRCFESEDIIHVAGTIDPIDDIETVELELILSDLEMAQNVSTRLQKQLKSNKDLKDVALVLEQVVAHLNDDLPLRTLDLSKEQLELLQPYPFLTQKKVLYLANVSENDLPEMTNQYVERVADHAKKVGAQMLPICAKIESEIAELDADEQLEFLQSVGLEETGLNRLVHTCFDLLGLMTFFTTGEMETRAWTVPKGAVAPEAAGKIHTDIQNGFIRAEVIGYEDMVACGGRAQARQEGKLRAEGRDYPVQDGDVINFLHN